MNNKNIKFKYLSTLTSFFQNEESQKPPESQSVHMSSLKSGPPSNHLPQLKKLPLDTIEQSEPQVKKLPLNELGASNGMQNGDGSEHKSVESPSGGDTDR